MMSVRMQRLLAAAGTATLALIVYIITLAPSVDFIDAGELAAVAHSFGIAHPTGYPLFTMLAGLWAWLPLGDGIVRLNLLSAVLAATGVGFLVDALWMLLGLQLKKSSGKGGKKAAAEQRGVSSGWTRSAAAVIGALVVALSRTYWRTALSIEVYALHMCMLGVLFWALLRLLTALSREEQTPTGTRNALLLLAFLLGLSFSNHMSTIFLLPGLLLVFVLLRSKGLLRVRLLLMAAGVFVLGLLPYLYLPLRAAAEPALNWGNPSSLERLLWHVSGKQYSVWMFSSSDAWQEQFSNIATLLPQSVGYVALLPALFGEVMLFRRHAVVAGGMLLFFATCIFWASGYDIHDIDSYLLLAIVVIGCWTAVGIDAFVRMAQRRWSLAPRYGVLAGALLIVPLALHASSVSQRGNYLVEDYTKAMFASFEPGSLVLSYQWDHWVSAALYFQMVEGWRPDVIVLDKELFRRSWYLDQLRVNHPDIYEPSRREIEAFRVHLDRFERDLPYDPTAIENAYNAMINSVIDRFISRGPVYLTLEIEQQFAPGYVRVPEGLAFRLFAPDSLPAAATRKLPDVRFRPFASEERLAKDMWSMLASMLVNHGVFQHSSGEFDRADAAFDAALRYSPQDARILEWKRRNTAARAQDAAPPMPVPGTP